jgi:transposase
MLRNERPAKFSGSQGEVSLSWARAKDGRIPRVARTAMLVSLILVLSTDQWVRAKLKTIRRILELEAGEWTAFGDEVD